MKHQIIKKRHPKKKIILITLGVIVGLAVIVVATELTNTTHFFHARRAVSSTIVPASTGTNKKNTSSADKESAPSTDPTPQPTDTNTSSGSPKEGDSTSNSSTNAPLVEPYGNFVSNHSPGKNGSSIETSVCLTTPGAQCSITFTSTANPSVVKTLAAGTADSSGAVYWNNWDVKAAGFTNGTWQIKAVATLNGQTKSTADKTNFEVVL
jgi:cytoskeletal protein RodZ